ncbi:Hsp70 family protein [Lysinibacillus xylanilyticus]|uniref:Hsp70 family protein n=1 Tax=Lysinibacillus xylanilyticus TaxID=582475 RepID=UPI0036DA73F0
MRSEIFTNNNINASARTNNVLGLDLGTTNSVVTAKISDGLPKVLKSHSGETTPSCVLFKDDGTYLIGSDAYAQRHLPNAVYSFKKYMGTSKKLYQDYIPRNIASMFVKTLLEQVKELNPEFSNYFEIQVSVPAYFDMNQIEDTKLAIEDAGYHVVGVNDEPTAAAILYQQAKRVKEDILIFDLGGGTFDSVLMRNVPGIPGDSREFYKSLGVELQQAESVLEILDVSGDNHLGGDDIDRIAVDLFMKKHRLKPTEEMYQKALLVAERVKKLGVPIELDFTKHPFSWSFIEKATQQVLDRCMEIMNSMLNRAKVFNVNCVLCGGSTKSGIIREELAKRFTISTEIDPDLAVGVGNSIKYNMDAKGSGLSIVSRLAKGVGVLAGGQVKYLADKGTIVPYRGKFVARNSEPFGTFVDIDLYQGEKFTGEHTHISTISLKDIKGHNEDGYVEIIIDLVITSDGTISVEVASGEASIKSDLVLTEGDGAEESSDIHPEAKLYNRFKNSAEHYQDVKLYDLVEEYKVTGSRDLAKQITTYLGQLAN